MTLGWTEMRRRTNKVERGGGEALDKMEMETGTGTGWEVNIRRTR